MYKIDKKSLLDVIIITICMIFLFPAIIIYAIDAGNVFDFMFNIVFRVLVFATQAYLLIRFLAWCPEQIIRRRALLIGLSAFYLVSAIVNRWVL